MTFKALLYLEGGPNTDGSKGYGDLCLLGIFLIPLDVSAPWPLNLITNNY